MQTSSNKQQGSSANLGVTSLLTSEFSIPLINVHLTLVYVCNCCSSDQYNM